MNKRNYLVKSPKLSWKRLKLITKRESSCTQLDHQTTGTLLKIAKKKTSLHTSSDTMQNLKSATEMEELKEF